MFPKHIRDTVPVVKLHLITVHFAMILARAWNREEELNTFCNQYLGGVTYCTALC